MMRMLVCLALPVVSGAALAAESWRMDSQVDWEQNTAAQSNLEVKDGVATPTAKNATFQSVLKRFENRRLAKSIVVAQSPVWLNWEPIGNIGPDCLYDAPVLLSLGPKDYWLFARHNRSAEAKAWDASKGEFVPKPAHLEGFDIPLLTTPLAHQFRAPGGLKPNRGGFHAWQSRDMVNWVHHGPVTDRNSSWVTTAEYVDGKAYIYYDFPNDQDPHLYIDDDLTDGTPGKNLGMAFKDPSHGSDCGIIRSLDANFHLIYEDWSPIHPNSHAFDSPLAGHAVSRNGRGNFKILAPALDKRTRPTGVIKTFRHPDWVKEDPEHFKSDIGEYEVHEPEQDCFGDWAPIAVGGQYYLFCDYHPANGKEMSVGVLTASSINEPFTLCGHVGKGHPDPDICFAEGEFYLVTQTETDFVSPGPWVERVEVRVGVDTNDDAVIDQWTDWGEVQEHYDYTPGFAKQVRRTPARLELASLPAGYGFQYEFKISDTTENESMPIIDTVSVSFK